MTRKTEEKNSDRMVQKYRASFKQPQRAGTGPESQTYKQRTGVFVLRDEANKLVGKADKASYTAKKSGD